MRSMCTVADDLEIDIDASSNRAILSGKINAVSVTTSRVCLDGFMVSGGAALHTDEIIVQLPRPGAPTPRLAKPFSVSVRAKLTEADLNRDGPVRDALQSLLRQIITTGLSGALGRALPIKIGGVECDLDCVELEDPKPAIKQNQVFWRGTKPQKSEGKIILHAHATLSSGRVFRFSVRTGLCTVNEGNIVKLNEPELIWRHLSVPMITIAMIGVKLEDTTKLTHVEIDRGMLSGDGIMVIAPSNDIGHRMGSARDGSVRTDHKSEGATQRTQASAGFV